MTTSLGRSPGLCALAPQNITREKALFVSRAKPYLLGSQIQQPLQNENRKISVYFTDLAFVKILKDKNKK